jgi:tRNA U54 and U55 pseudouridine synthase Pus10
MVSNKEKDSELIQVDIKRTDGDIKLYVKTCSKFEDYLKKTRKISKTKNFCNTEQAKEFYDVRLDRLSENATVR